MIVEIDNAGYLLNFSAWQHTVAEEMAQADGINLTPQHWQVILFLREFYQIYQHSPSIRAMVNALKEKFGPEVGNSIYLQQLFPVGPAKQACRYAGLPKPKRCVS